MTEKDAIEVLLKNVPKCCKLVDGRYQGGFDDWDCDMGQAIRVAVLALQEVQQYRAIGTVEECKKAVEKQIPQKPFKGADFMVVRDDDGSHIWESDYICHECGMGIAREYICCPYCGTYIDWSKEGDKSREEDDH